MNFLYKQYWEILKELSHIEIVTQDVGLSFGGGQVVISTLVFLQLFSSHDFRFESIIVLAISLTFLFKMWHYIKFLQRSEFPTVKNGPVSKPFAIYTNVSCIKAHKGFIINMT